jgi:hypothetical protein
MKTIEERMEILEEKVLILDKRSTANPYAGEASKEVEITDENHE